MARTWQLFYPLEIYESIHRRSGCYPFFAKIRFHVCYVWMIRALADYRVVPLVLV